MKVLLFRGRGLISALIRWQTRSRWSHAAILDPGTMQMYEAWQGGGVRMKWWPNVTDRKDIEVFDVPVTNEQRVAMCIFLRAQLGKRYDYLSVIRFVTRHRSKDDSKWFCSEMVYAAFQAAGINLLAPDVMAWEVSPGMLAKSPLLQKVL